MPSAKPACGSRRAVVDVGVGDRLAAPHADEQFAELLADMLEDAVAGPKMTPGRTMTSGSAAARALRVQTCLDDLA
ncbi:MAG: hypothetical protein U0992_12475 [Planctomycetaceae bacterium]